MGLFWCGTTSDHQGKLEARLAAAQKHLLLIHLQFYHILSNRSCLFFLIGPVTDGILTYDHVDNVKGEDVNGEQGEGHGEQVEVSVVPLAHTVADPGTVVIKPICEQRGSHMNTSFPLCLSSFYKLWASQTEAEQHQKTDANILLYFTSLQQTQRVSQPYTVSVEAQTHSVKVKRKRSFLYLERRNL